MTLRVEIEDGKPISGHLLYLANEYSFMYQASDDVELQRRVGGEGVTSIVADTLQIEVGVETGQLLFAWGYFPHSSWRESESPPPKMIPGVLKIKDIHELQPGVSISISRGSQWNIEFNRSNGWLGVAISNFDDVNYVQIADDVAIGVKESRIVSIWLHPEIIK